MRIVYIAGCTHGGTTLMHRILGTHPKVASLGSVKNLPRAIAGQQRCSCGAPLATCPHWGAIDAALRAATGRPLAALAIDSPEGGVFRADNRALFEAAAAATGAEVIVDSSRMPRRLAALEAAFGDALTVVHLYRRPEAQVFSWRKRDRSPVDGIRTYNRLHRAFLKARPQGRVLRISYEGFCREPEAALAEIFPAIGLAHDPSVPERWGAYSTHVLGGNPMLRSESSEIRLDDAWTRLQPAMLNLIARLACAPTYAAMQWKADLPG